jgi:hypothetical protein
MSAKKSPVQQAADLLEKTQTELSEILKDAQYGTISLSILSDIERIRGRLSHLSGIPLTARVAEEFPPVTNFMGEEIERVTRKEVLAEDLDPDAEEKANFLAKVDKLYAEFDTLAPEGILNAFTIPEDQMVVRAVAKRAGLDDYEEATINLDFLDKISRSMKKKAAEEKDLARVETELATQQQIADVSERLKIATEKADQLVEDLIEAEGEAEKAKTDAQKKKAGEKVAGIKEEITAAATLREQLEKELKPLHG